MKQTINFDYVADIYDFYVSTDFDVNFFLNETKEINEEILELMCGTGRASIPLLEAGRKMVCVDYSEGMLNVFRKKISGKNYIVELINMNVTELKLNRKFDFIFLPFHSLSEIISKELQIRALTKISEHLNKDGIFICTLQNPVIRLKSADGTLRMLGKFDLNEDRNMIISYMNRYDENTKLVSGFQFYEIFDENNKLIEKRFLEINFKPIFYEEFLEMVKDTGLEIVNIYGDYEYSDFDESKSEFMIFKLGKK
jgi:SAM-dependent methyltransferase